MQKMPVTTESLTLEVHAVREVDLPVNYELRAAAVRFYSEVLGLAPWPEERQIPGAIGLGPQRCGLLLRFAHDAATDPVRTRLSLRTNCLTQVESELRARGWPYARLNSFGAGDSRLLLSDPAGHLLEIRESRRW